MNDGIQKCACLDHYAQNKSLYSNGRMVLITFEAVDRNPIKVWPPVKIKFLSSQHSCNAV